MTKDEILKLYESGNPQSAIAKLYGVSQSFICHQMMKFQIRARPKTCGLAHPTGPLHHNWKGSAATYKCLHERIYRLRGQPQLCEACGKRGGLKRYHWANLTGRYSDPTDYKRMCVPCHHEYDKRFQILKLGPTGKMRWMKKAV
jgi:hypothetical protein